MPIPEEARRFKGGGNDRHYRLLELRLSVRSLAAPAAANQIDGGTELEKRIVRGFDPFDARDRIEDDLFLLVSVICNRCGKDDLAEVYKRPVLRPMFGGVVDNITIVCDLDKDVETDRSFGDSFCEFVEEKVRFFGLRCCVVEMIVSGLRNDSVSSEV